MNGNPVEKITTYNVVARMMPLGQMILRRTGNEFDLETRYERPPVGFARNG
jgi:hypothetical protein